MASAQSLSPPNVTDLLPPPGTNFLVIIDGGLLFLMIGATMGSALFVMLLALLYFSTTSMRRKPVLILNVISILFGISGAIINVYDEVHTFTGPLVPLNPRVILTFGTLTALIPLLVDSILLLRLYSVFPHRATSRLKLATILGISILIKMVRLVNSAVYLAKYSQNVQTLTTSAGRAGATVLVTSPLPNVKIEWFLQMFDNSYSSVIFLYQFHRQSASSRRNQTISQKITTLFWISTSNFVFPVMLSIAQIAIYMARRDDYLVALYIEQVNVYFTIMGVVFATVWVAEARWQDGNRINQGSGEVLSSICFGPMPGDQKKHTNIKFVPSPDSSMSQLTLEMSVHTV